MGVYIVGDQTKKQNGGYWDMLQKGKLKKMAGYFLFDFDLALLASV